MFELLLFLTYCLLDNLLSLWLNLSQQDGKLLLTDSGAQAVDPSLHIVLLGTLNLPEQPLCQEEGSKSHLISLLEIEGTNIP